MTTKNPKISGYVPQEVYDRFKEFQDERKLSMSQSLIVILCEYFGIEQLVNGNDGVEVGGVTLSGFQKLESAVGINQQAVEGLFEKIERLESELSKSLLSKPPVLEVVVDEPAEKLLSKSPIPELKVLAKRESSSQLNLLGNLSNSIDPIQGRFVVLRFGITQGLLSANKSKLQNQKWTIERFTEWTKEKDMDGIAWKYVEKPSKGYVPAEELSSELQSKLLKWIEENTE